MVIVEGVLNSIFNHVTLVGRRCSYILELVGKIKVESHPETEHLRTSVINVEGLKRCRVESRPRLQSTDKYTVRKTDDPTSIYINIRIFILI